MSTPKLAASISRRSRDSREKRPLLRERLLCDDLRVLENMTCPFECCRWLVGVGRGDGLYEGDLEVTPPGDMLSPKKLPRAGRAVFPADFWPGSMRVQALNFFAGRRVRLDSQNRMLY
jgi:hypothetical protein